MGPGAFFVRGLGQHAEREEFLRSRRHRDRIEAGDDVEPMYLLALVCYYGPTPLGALMAGWQAAQCKSPVQAFLVGLIGTVALAVVFGVAADYLPIWGHGLAIGQVWQMHLMFSPIVAVPVAAYCAFLVHQRSLPPTDRVG